MSTADAPPIRKTVTLHRLREMHAARARRSPCSPATTPPSRASLDEAGVDCILVGDSLGMVVQGHTSTIPVSLDEIVYHTRCVARGNRTAWVDRRFAFRQLPGQSREQALAAPSR
jgi:3-methyl-2-oxobutanoate hydroxymethyltransferase